jgi:hypothetical protein
MKSEFLTVVAVILLGLNHGIMQAYLNTADKASGFSQEIINVAIPTTLNTLCFFILIWGISTSSKSTTSKAILIVLLISLIMAELYYVYAKPSSLILGQIILHVSTIFKLYILITLHCDVTSGASNDFISKTSNFIEKQIAALQSNSKSKKAQVQPLKIETTNVDIAKATQIFNEALGKAELTPEEKIELKDKFTLGIDEENPWNTMWNVFNNSVLNRIGEDMSKEEKDLRRNNFRIAMGKTPR